MGNGWSGIIIFVVLGYHNYYTYRVFFSQVSQAKRWGGALAKLNTCEQIFKDGDEKEILEALELIPTFPADFLMAYKKRVIWLLTPLTKEKTFSSSLRENTTDLIRKIHQNICGT